METILSYLESMFLHLPKTPEVLRLKEEMAANMEDKYIALKSEGKSENEAVGAVIAEFGNIEEIALEMGIDLGGGAEGDTIPLVDFEEAEAYIAASQRGSVFVSGGVALIFLGIISLLICVMTGDDRVMPGVILLILFIAVSVGLFIYSDSITEPYQYLEGMFQLTMRAKSRLLDERAKNRGIHTAGTIAGVSSILVGVAILLFFIMRGNNILIGVCILLLFILAGVIILILTGKRPEALDVLLQTGDYSPERKEQGRIIGAVAAIWWPVTVAIFLAWGFLGKGGWGISWVVWPISGVLFGAISGLTSVLEERRR